MALTRLEELAFLRVEEEILVYGSGVKSLEMLYEKIYVAGNAGFLRSKGIGKSRSLEIAKEVSRRYHLLKKD